MDDEIFALILQLSIDDTYGLSFGASDLDIGARLQREKMQDYLSKKGGSKVLSSASVWQLPWSLRLGTRYNFGGSERSSGTPRRSTALHGTPRHDIDLRISSMNGRWTKPFWLYTMTRINQREQLVTP